MAAGDKFPVVMGEEKAAAYGVATLDADGVLALNQRPSADGINAVSKLLTYYPISSSPDINTILDGSFVLSKSFTQNCPLTGAWIVIYQFFYQSISASSARVQVALPYSTGTQGNGMAIRTYSTLGVWSEWETVYTNQQPPTAAEVGAAPSGFGLGETTPGDIPIGTSGTRDINLAVKTGWYYITSNLTYDNSPIGKTGFPPGGYHVMRVEGFYFITQTIYFGYQTFTGCAVQRHTLNANNYGAWSEWEWVNPPMQLGVEYRTTERYNEKPVYTKLFDFGYLPVNTFKIVAHNIANVQQVLSITGSPIDGKANIPTQSWMNGYWKNNVDLIADKANIQIVTKDCDNNLTETITIYVTLKYTKTTD